MQVSHIQLETMWTIKKWQTSFEAKSMKLYEFIKKLLSSKPTLLRQANIINALK